MTYAAADIERILTAVETLEECLGILADKQSLDREYYRGAPETQDIVERRFVKATEAALDIAETIVAEERGTHPESNPAVMQALAEIGAVAESTGEEMAKAARFRNVLAHTYGDIINDDIVYDALQDIARYRTFLVEVGEYLDERNALDG